MKIDYFSSNAEVLREIGARIKAIRIDRAITQSRLAEMTNISQRTISNLENGKDVSFTTLIDIMRALGQLQNIDILVPETTIRPSQMIKEGKQRERASSRDKGKRSNSWKWGDEE